MGCSSCRRPPRATRQPSVVQPANVGNKKSSEKKPDSQRARITGLTYVPKG